MSGTIHQVLDENGKPKRTAGNAPAWFILGPDDATSPRVAYGKTFSDHKRGNDVEFFVTGQAYFNKVAAAIAEAEKSIFITGWQVNLDVELRPGKTLFKCLHEALSNKPKLRVYVMPWMSPKAGLDTGDFETLLMVYHLNAGLDGPQRAFALPAIQQSDMGGALGIGFSHHQKLVVVDNKAAFMGGIDLAYGRRDDERFLLHADGRKGSELYNGCVPPLHAVTLDETRAYVNRLELLLACFDTWYTKAGAWLASAPSEPVVAARETVDATVAQAKKGVAAGGQALEDAAAYWESAPVTRLFLGALRAAVEKAKKASKPAGQAAGTALDMHPLVAPAKKAISSAKDAVVYEWEKIQKDLQERLLRLQDTASANAADAVVALLSWLHHASLENVDPVLLSEIGDAVGALTLAATATLSAAADERKERYENLHKLGKVLPMGMATLDPEIQPRMPWHDVHCQIQGPSVYDLSLNFVQRWNGLAYRYGKAYKRATGPLNEKVLTPLGLRAPTFRAPRIPKDLEPKPDPSAKGGCWVQVLRSAPARLQGDEAKAAGEAPTKAAPQNNCLQAMIKAIRHAQDFIYIEGQFFQSHFGGDPTARSPLSGPLGSLLDLRRSPAYTKYRQPMNLGVLEEVTIERIVQGELSTAQLGDILKKIRWEGAAQVPKDAAGASFLADLNKVLGNITSVGVTRAMGPQQKHIKNPLLEELAARIQKNIFARAVAPGQGKPHPFHVYMVLPVHPEGRLDALNIMGQVHLTMQSLVHGSHSLVNRVRQAILATRYMQQEGIPREKAEARVARMKPDDVEKAVGDAWQNHLTLLNLRNWELFGKRPVTEQVYVHSKLLIADDRVAILGSANINDRSMWGDRDSELAVIIADENPTPAPLRGDGRPLPVGAKVHQLRKRLWAKLFGLAAEGLKGSPRPASTLAGVLDKPAAPATWRAIQQVAQDNQKAYEEAFRHVPRSVAHPAIQSPTQKVRAPFGSIWPTWQYKNLQDPREGGHLVNPMPFEAAFWRGGGQGPEAQPKDIQGFITALPVGWTAGENNAPGMHLALLAGNQGLPGLWPSEPPVMVATASNPVEEIGA